MASAQVALGWRGWAALVLLVIPASAVAILAIAAAGRHGSPAWTYALAALALMTLAGAGVALRRVVSSLRRMTELAQALGEHGGRPVFVKDVQHRYQFVNGALAALLGRIPEEIVGRRDRELAPGPAALAYEENDSVCLERGLPTMFRESLGADDAERTFVVGKYPLHDARGRIAGLVGIAQDVTDTLALQKLASRRSDEMRVWFDRNPLPVVMFGGGDQHVANANPAALRCYGYDRTRMLLLRLPDLFAPDEHERLRAYLGEEGRAIPPGSLAWQHRRADGTRFEVLADMGNLPHEAGSMHVMMVRDVSGERAARTELRAAEARYDELLESGLALVWTQDFAGRLLRVNTATADALGHVPESMDGRSLSDFVVPEGRAEWADFLDRIRILPRDTGLLHLRSHDGEQRVWQYRFVCHPRAEPAPYVLVMAQDVTLRDRYEGRVRAQNRRDPLTGCRTRGYLDAFALQTSVDQVWGCIMVDVDRFQQLNEARGHERGDDVLRWVALVLASHAGADAEVVRLADDQFALVVAHATGAGLRERAEALAVASGPDAPATFSVGWALREGGETVEATLRRADKALLRRRARPHTES